MTYMIQSIDNSKAFQKDDIPPKSLKANVDICSIVLTSDVNRCIVNGTFPNTVKPLNSGHLPDWERVSAIGRCPLFRG